MLTVILAGRCWASSPDMDSIVKGSVSSLPLAASCSHDHLLSHHNISGTVYLLFFLWYIFCSFNLNFETTPKKSAQKIGLTFS